MASRIPFVPPTAGVSEDMVPTAMAARRAKVKESPTKDEAGLPLLAQPNPCPVQGVPSYQRLWQALSWWEQHAPREVCELIRGGVRPHWSSPPILRKIPQFQKSTEEVQRATEILKDYQRVGAVKVVTADETAFLVPWFIVSKE